MPTADIRFFATESFNDQYSKSTPSQKLNALASYCENVWDGDIDDGNYALSTTVNQSITIPDSALPTSQGLSGRMDASDNYLESNLSGYWGVDGIIVADYFIDDFFGQSPGANATQNVNKTAIVDCGWEDTNSLPPSHELTAAEGTAWHELCHLFDADHVDASVFSNGESTVMWQEDPEPSCNVNAVSTVRLQDVSTCSRSSIREYYDDHDYYIG